MPNDNSSASHVRNLLNLEIRLEDHIPMLKMIQFCAHLQGGIFSVTVQVFVYRGACFHLRFHHWHYHLHRYPYPQFNTLPARGWYTARFQQWAPNDPHTTVQVNCCHSFRYFIKLYLFWVGMGCRVGSWMFLFFLFFFLLPLVKLFFNFIFCSLFLESDADVEVEGRPGLVDEWVRLKSAIYEACLQQKIPK